MRTITIGGTERRIEPFSGRKVNRTLRLLKAIANAVPDLLDKRAAFIRSYQAANVIELDRAQAMLRYGAPVAVTTPDGDLVYKPDGTLETVPSPITQMTEEAWERSGHVLRLPKSPSQMEEIWALFPDVFEKAEDLVTKLLALAVMPNADVKRYAREGSLDDKLLALGEDLLDDSMGDELLELAVTAGEVIDAQLVEKGRQLKRDDRLGKLASLVGMGKAPEEETPDSAPATVIVSQTPDSTPDSSSASTEPGSAEEQSST